MITNKTHKFLEFLDLKLGGIFRVQFIDGQEFLLRIKYPIDTSIYGTDGGWCADIINMVSDPENKFHKPGNGLDFYECDVSRIYDDKGNIIYFRDSVTESL
jgi:hypothetical protein